MTAESRLFKPLTVGNMKLQHRVGMAPLTRYRADDDHVPTDMMVEYYAQRASVPGTLLVTEGTFISREAGGYDNVPGIYNDAQIAAWRRVTDVVHAKGSYIYCQLWALGRAANEDIARKEGFRVRSASAIPIADGDHAVPEPLSTDEVRKTVGDYAAAARNAIAAGFDGVEIHGANGYLIDQFIQDVSNQRTDEYGGSIENRSRFAVEVVDAIVAAVGAERTGIRLSPWSDFQSMRMDDPIPQFSDVIRSISHHKLAYLHLIRFVNLRLPDGGRAEPEGMGLDFAVNLWDGPLLIAGRLTPDNARELVDEAYPGKDVVAIFGRYFISTPDLPFRIRTGLDVNPYDFSTFYTAKAARGYTDLPFSKEFEQAQLAS